MKLPPVEVVLKWPTPNYVNPPTRGPALLIVNCIFITLVIITVALRLYTRIWIKRWFGIDDVFILIALLFTFGLTAIVILANQKYGWNRHIYDIPFDQFEPTLKIAMTAKVIFTAAGTFTRLSLHCFYYRLVADIGNTKFVWVIHANVVYSVGILTSYIFIAVFLCIPVSAYWTPGAVGYCLDEGVATLICGIITCVADLLTTITPLPLVLKLRLPRRQRIAVGFLFSLGIIVTIAGVVRTWFIYRSLFNEYDTTWYAYPLWVAAAVEIDLGVICASAPALRPLFKKIPFNLSDTFSCDVSFLKSSSSKGFKNLSSNSTRIVPVTKSPPSKGFTDMSGFTGLTGFSDLDSTGTGVVPITSNPSAKRKPEVLHNIPEVTASGGKSYEMRPWEDVERQTPHDMMERSNQDAIVAIAEEPTPVKAVHGLFEKTTSGEGRTKMPNNMTITRTSELELQVSTRITRAQHALSRTTRSWTFS